MAAISVVVRSDVVVSSGSLRRCCRLGTCLEGSSRTCHLADVLELISAGQEYLGRVAAVVTAADEHAPGHTASLYQPVGSLYSFGDRFVKFILNTPGVGPAEGPRRNTFSVLMASGAPTHLPNKYQPIQNNKQLLFNDDVVMWRENDLEVMKLTELEFHSQTAL